MDRISGFLVQFLNRIMEVVLDEKHYGMKWNKLSYKENQSLKCQTELTLTHSK